MVKFTEHDRDSHEKVYRILDDYVGHAYLTIKLRLREYLGMHNHSRSYQPIQRLLYSRDRLAKIRVSAKDSAHSKLES